MYFPLRLLRAASRPATTSTCLPTIAPVHRGPPACLLRPNTVSRPAGAAFMSTVLKRPPEYLHARNMPLNKAMRKKKGGNLRRKGRGDNSAGRGNKGWGKYHRGGVGRAYEGGQTPITKSIPKLGDRDHAKRNKQKKLTVVALDTIQYWIDTGRIDPTRMITLEGLINSKCLTKVREQGYILMARGGEHFHAKIDIEATDAEPDAIKLVEANGGTLKTVYHDPAVIQSWLQPDRWAIMPENFGPTDLEDIARYTDPSRRGYLSWVAEGVEKHEIVKRVLEMTQPKPSKSQ
ncbi:YmL10 [Borealophlyctis nickersoniae]|nr:YmL10 [Borealophlyctis nickersoniae]